MKISYRASSVLVMLPYVVVVAYVLLFPNRSAQKSVSVLDTAMASFDPCQSMWEQMPLPRLLAGLFAGPCLFAVFVQGLRNRPVRRWVALTAILSFSVLVSQDTWRLEHCMTPFSYMSLGAIVFMCVHHLLPRSNVYHKKDRAKIREAES